MRVIWTPTEGERREWEFAPSQLRTVEAEAIENVGGSRWDNLDTFENLLIRGNRRARRAVLWILLRREKASLNFDTLDLQANEVTIDYWGETEKAWIRERMLAGVEDIDPEIRAVWVRVLGEDPTEADPKAEPSD